MNDFDFNMLCIFGIQLSQAGDLIIEVYLEEKTPDCCITLKVSTLKCAIVLLRW